MANEITEITRRAIIDFISVSEVRWSGRLTEEEFLARLFDLTALPSTDHRVSDAAGDIHQHRTRWNDWSDDWVFFDGRFNLLGGDDGTFLRFLSETVHPIVRPDSDEAAQLVVSYNKELAPDGWELAPVKHISGRPIVAGMRIGQPARVYDEPTGWQKVDRQVQELRLRLDSAEAEEQCQAVGLLCREVLITVAQEVFDPERHQMQSELTPSDTDARRMLESIIAHEFRGSADEEARRHAKAALSLALALQHKRTADFRLAALCAEATSSVVNILAVLAGRRGMRV